MSAPKAFACALALSSCLLASPGRAGAAEPLRLGIYPLLETTEVVRRFIPLTRYLEARTGRRVAIEVSKDYAEHMERTGADTYDLSYLGPALYVSMLSKFGSKPILARLENGGALTYRGAIITRLDSLIRSLDELTGKRFAFGDRNSTMGHVVPRHMLWKAGVRVEDLVGYDFLKNQEDVALGVLAGYYDAGAVREQVYEQYKKRGLRVIAWSAPLSEHLFVARKSLDRGTLDALRGALFDVSTAPGGKAVLESLQRNVTALVPAKESDYAALRSLVEDLAKMGVRP